MSFCRAILLFGALASVAAAFEAGAGLEDGPASGQRSLQMATTPAPSSPETDPEPLPNYGPLLPNEAFSDPVTPQQIHLTRWTKPTVMLVSFTVGDPTPTNSTPTPDQLPDTKGMKPVVRFGLTTEKFKTAKGKSVAYLFDNSWDFQAPNARQGYVSAPIHHVLLKGLKPATKYFYSVAAGKDMNYSDWYSFTTLPEKGVFPVKVGVMADFGNTDNGTTTMLRMLGESPSIVHIVGDLTYADLYYPDGAWGGDEKSPGKYKTAYQQAWDQWVRAMQPLFTSVPIMTTPGNHELEFGPPLIGGAVFSSYNARFPMPQTPNPIKQTTPLLTVTNDTVTDLTTNMFYSYDIAGVAKIIFITSYIPSDHYTPDTAQYKWFEKVLKSVNRKKTPWVVVHSHAPWYSSWAGSFKDTECMRLSYEPLLLKYGVDLFINGHTHSYERFVPVYDNVANDCGTIHITIGMGGKPGNPPDGHEALDAVPIEDVTWSYCQSSAAWIKKFSSKPTLMGNACPTVQPWLNGNSTTNICWTAQPPFSAIRNAAYGFGTLEFLSATQARWKMFRNADAPGAAYDEVLLDRSLPANCTGAR